MTTQAPAPTHQTTTRSRLPRINRRAQFARRARRADLLVTLLWASGAAAAALYLAYGGASQMTSVAGFITGLGILLGLVGTDFILVLLVLAARIPIVRSRPTAGSASPPCI